MQNDQPARSTAQGSLWHKLTYPGNKSMFTSAFHTSPSVQPRSFACLGSQLPSSG